jgi:acyl carrier protein
MDGFCNELARILDVESVTADDKFKEIGIWDSLTALSLSAMLDTKYGTQLTTADFNAVETVRELHACVEKSIAAKKEGKNGR